MYRLFSVLIVLMIADSCKKKEAAPDCGCEGSTYATVESVEAGYLGNGIFIINKLDQHNHLMYVLPCIVDATWTKTADANDYNYTISGNFKTRCRTIDDATSISVGAPFQITSIKKNKI